MQWIKRFILFHNKRHPRDMGPEEIRQFLTHLAMRHRVTASTQNQALSAILFLYKAVLQQDIAWVDEIVWAKNPKRLPVVLMREFVGINDLARFCFPAPKLSEDQQTYFRFDVIWTVHTQEYKNQQILIAL